MQHVLRFSDILPTETAVVTMQNMATERANPVLKLVTCWTPVRRPVAIPNTIPNKTP